MLRILFFFLTTILIFTLGSGNVHAIIDPDSLPNNKFGVHILFPSELQKARELVNSSGGDWGYVTIPIQSGDKNIEKWQKFMDDAGRLHLIPIIRIATENYHFNTIVWRKPSEADVLDFANFLNSLNWPVKNRYIIIFNEVNRGDEWEGIPNPSEYAEILSYSTKIFKSLNPDFFIISGGLDNAAANIPTKFFNQYDFMVGMDKHIPGIFNQIDGLGSHSYPNPGFSQAPWEITDKSISSFKFEKNLAFELSGKNLPVFITETGWSRDKIEENKIASYYVYAFETVWSDDNIVAVTPFILQAGAGPFSQFTILNENGDLNEVSKTLQKILKTKGTPTINTHYSSSFSVNISVPFKTFPQKTQYENLSIEKIRIISPFLKWILKVSN